MLSSGIDKHNQKPCNICYAAKICVNLLKTTFYKQNPRLFPVFEAYFF